jgi:hypothetical protein
MGRIVQLDKGRLRMCVEEEGPKAIMAICYNVNSASSGSTL